MLRTPLYDWHVSHGGRMVEFAGWEMPIQYTSIVEEHVAVRQRAGLFDIAHMGRFFCTGPDAESFLDHLVTNDVTKMKAGQVRYALICNRAGGILDDVLVYHLDKCRWMLVVNASNREKIADWIEHHMEGYTVSVADETRDCFMLALQGPKALPILARCIQADLAGMKYYTAERVDYDTSEAIVSRTGYTGEDGYEVVVEKEAAVRLWEQIVAAGAPHGLAACGLGCRDTLRLEAAMPLYGHEMDERTDPFTAGLSFGVKLDGGDFIGRSSLLAQSTRPDLPKRTGLELAGRRIAREGAAVLHQQRQVGHVTSGTFSPTLQKSIAMAYLPAELTQPGTEVEVDIRGKREAAVVVRLPFHKRK